MTRCAFVMAMAMTSTTAAAHRLAPDAITGFWRTEGGEAIFEIVAHEQTYAGRIVWLRDPVYPPDDAQGMGGQPVVDRNNSDAAKRDRPLLGLELLTGLRYRHERGKARWREGQIYNSENGKRYQCEVWLADTDHLKLRGYIGRPILGSTTTWKRVPDPGPANDRSSLDTTRS